VVYDLASNPTAVEEQEDVLTAAQAFALYGRAHVRAQIAAKRWRRPARGVVVRHNGPLTRTQQHWVALLRCPPDTVLGGITALRYDGFDGFDSFDSERPVLVLPDGGRCPSDVAIKPHWSRELSSADVHPLRLPPRTRPQRSLVDAASWSPRHAERRARAIILAGVQQRLVRTRDLREGLTRRGACRHRALIVESILDARGGIQSLPELDFEMIRRRRGLPEPSRQAPRRRADGRYYLDVEWRDFDAACEIHGIPHLRVLQWESDLERANDITIAGPRLLIFSSYAVRRRQDRVGDQLVGLLRRGGWST
jgi:hypothetical protein